MLMLLTGQRVFRGDRLVRGDGRPFLWGDRGGYDIGFSAAIKLMRWYPLLTLPMFYLHGDMCCRKVKWPTIYIKMFHVWMGGLRGDWAIGRSGCMVVDSAMNGCTVGGHGDRLQTIALPEAVEAKLLTS